MDAAELDDFLAASGWDFRKLVTPPG